MSEQDLINRWVGQLTGLSESKLSSGMFEQSKWPEITKAIETIENLPIYINDSARLKTTDIQADLCTIEAGVDAVCVDYLELLGDTAENANEATARKSRGFREICKEQNVAGLIIQSMTKDGISAATGGITQGTGKKGFASSQAAMVGVRGPADIMHDADTIFMLVIDPADETGKTIAALPAKKRHGNGDKNPIRFVWNKTSPKLESAARY
jgi:replicative DNA helicase